MEHYKRFKWLQIWLPNNKDNIASIANMAGMSDAADMAKMGNMAIMNQRTQVQQSLFV